MNNNLFLVYTGLQRRAEKVAGKYIPKLNNKKKTNIKKILNHVIEANKLIKKITQMILVGCCMKHG